MPYYAVIDTNVIIAALLTKNSESSTVRIMTAVLSGEIIPLFHQDIIDEYNEVLHRKKFHFGEYAVQKILKAIKQFGVEVFPEPTEEIFIDEDDLIFYEVAMEKDAYLITGNQKHYPAKKFIVSPAEMLEIMKNKVEVR